MPSKLWVSMPGDAFLNCIASSELLSSVAAWISPGSCLLPLSGFSVAPDLSFSVYSVGNCARIWSNRRRCYEQDGETAWTFFPNQAMILPISLSKDVR
jgi:hypothetical protein